MLYSAVAVLWHSWLSATAHGLGIAVLINALGITAPVTPLVHNSLLLLPLCPQQRPGRYQKLYVQLAAFATRCKIVTAASAARGPFQVSAPDASVVILLHPDNVASPADAEALKAAAAMSISTIQGTAAGSSSGSSRRKQQRMIVQMPSEWSINYWVSERAAAAVVSAEAQVW